MNMKTTELIRSNALKYERYKDQFESIDPKEIEIFRNDVETAWTKIDRLFTIKFVDFDPYTCLAEMSKDIERGKMLVSTLNNDSRLLPGDLNLKFRATHDYLHYLLGQPFDFKGELNVYKAQKFLHSTETGRRMLYSEIVLQASYATYFGKFPTVQKLII